MICIEEDEQSDKDVICVSAGEQSDTEGNIIMSGQDQNDLTDIVCSLRETQKSPGTQVDSVVTAEIHKNLEDVEVVVKIVGLISIFPQSPSLSLLLLVPIPSKVNLL